LQRIGPAVLRCALLLVTLLALMAPGVVAPARAQTVEGGRLVLSAQDVWDYAEALFRQGEYYRAVSEFKRLAHFFPDSPLARAARVRIGEAHLHGGEPAQAIEQFTTLLEAPELAPLRPEVHYLRGMSRLELEHDAPYGLRKRHIAQALDDLRAIPPGWSGAPAVQGFVQALEQPGDLPSKSPWLAGGLSALLPGAGSVYVGNYAEGALAFFVNALFISASLRAFDQDNDGLGTVLGAAALAFYGGSIYAAANGAQRYNDHARGAYLEQQRTRFGLELRPGGVTGLLERRF
jgi:tetratricopeptide (TPR) repeat protein